MAAEGLVHQVLFVCSQTYYSTSNESMGEVEFKLKNYHCLLMKAINMKGRSVKS